MRAVLIATFCLCGAAIPATAGQIKTAHVSLPQIAKPKVSQSTSVGAGKLTTVHSVGKPVVQPFDKNTGKDSEKPTESFSINYENIQYGYKPQ